MFKEIEEIINGNYTVKEKRKMLNNIRSQFKNEIEQAEDDIINGYKYCPKCKEYYKEKAWEEENRMERREVCTFHSLAEFEDDRWEYKNCSVVYSICPMGHRIEEKVSW